MPLHTMAEPFGLLSVGTLLSDVDETSADLFPNLHGAPLSWSLTATARSPDPPTHTRL